MMEVDLLKQFVTSYGPLGFGWIAAAVLYVRVQRLQDQILQAFNANTQALTLLTAKITGGER